VASLETKHTYPGHLTPAAFLKRFGRIVPHLIINAGMLPHQFSAFVEGLFGPLHSEFERTPKTASVTTPPTAGSTSATATCADAPTSTPAAGTHALGASAMKAPRAKQPARGRVNWPYVLAEVSFVVLQLAWAVLFTASGLVWCALGAALLAGCVVFLGFIQGDRPLRSALL
jgi:hypothetical protein